jgi:hypothetical protein
MATPGAPKSGKVSLLGNMIMREENERRPGCQHMMRNTTG